MTASQHCVSVVAQLRLDHAEQQGKLLMFKRGHSKYSPIRLRERFQQPTWLVALSLSSVSIAALPFAPDPVPVLACSSLRTSCLNTMVTYRQH